MSPSSSRFSFVTSSTTSPFRTLELFQSGSTRVEDTTYLGMLFNRSASSPLRGRHRESGNWATSNRPVRPSSGVYIRMEVRQGAGRRGAAVGTADLISRARAGDGDAFRQLTEPHRRELQVHCYRMLGSFQDAEDAVQETMLAAWQGIGGFTEERASLRTWLYKVATNRCLNARRAASRRPVREGDMTQFEAPDPTPRDEPVWLQPFPDAFLEGAADRPLGPEARYEQSEAISLAFVTALQLLPPRQVAVLILRDVLG